MKYLNWFARLFYYHESIGINELHEGKGTEHDLLYDVTFIPQEHSNMCVEASVAMMKHFAGMPFHSMDENPRWWDGIDTLREKENHPIFAETKWSPIHGGGMPYLRKILEIYGPFMIAFPMKYSDVEHQVMVIGCTATHLIYHDPLETSGHRCINLEELTRIRKIKDKEVDEKKITHPVLTIVKFKKTLREQNLTNKRMALTKNIKTKLLPTTKYSGFFSVSTHWEEYCPYEAAIRLLKDYAYGSKIWNPFRNHREQVKQTIDALERRKRNLNPQLLHEILDAHLNTKRNPQGTLEKMLTTINVYIPHSDFKSH